MSLLEKAIAIAVETHQGKKDRAGQPYIQHSLRVKLADLEDNLDVRRLHALDEPDCARLNRYLAAYRRLRGA